MATKLVAGCGYLGLRVARRWRDAGDQVYAITRRPERVSALAGEGFRPILADVTRPETLDGLPPADTVLVAIGHDRQSGTSPFQVYVEGLEALLRRLPDTWQRLLHISSTGVYGQTRGEWVDEGSATEPVTDGGRACLAAERLVEAHRGWADRTITLRLAGLYGPGRVPRPRAAPAEEGRGAGLINLIHVEDAAEIVVLADRRLQPPERLVVSDGHPVRRSDYLAWLAHLPGIGALDAPQTPAGTRSQRGRTSKRVSNTRMLDRLGVTLRYPSYREGLAEAVSVEGRAGQG